MFCNKCGFSLIDNAKFCDQCGSPINVIENTDKLKYFCWTTCEFWLTMEKALFSFSGRVSRKTALRLLVHWVLTYILVAMLYFTLVGSVAPIKNLEFDRIIMFLAFTFIPGCFLILCFTTLITKRLHDAGHSGKFMIVPFGIRFLIYIKTSIAIGIRNTSDSVNFWANIMFIAIVLGIFCLDGESSPNEYGDNSL